MPACQAPVAAEDLAAVPHRVDLARGFRRFLIRFLLFHAGLRGVGRCLPQPVKAVSDPSIWGLIWLRARAQLGEQQPREAAHLRSADGTSGCLLGAFGFSESAANIHAPHRRSTLMATQSGL